MAVPDIVPGRLFFSRLPLGELEFSCLVVLSAASVDTTISWTLRPTDGSRRSLSVEQTIQDDEVKKGWAVLSAVVSPGWPDSILTVDIAGATSVHEVRRYQQSQRFGLPFDSDVLVVAGHRIGEPHRTAFELPTQQFAWDLLPLRPGNLAVLNSLMSEPPMSVDFACYGRPVLSPGDGVVAEVVDGLPDAELLGQQQRPLGARIDWAAGNHVIIRHDDQVYSCLAHLMAGSISVACGQEIKAAEPIATVGSSGNVSGPHLHFHFMDGTNFVGAAPLPIELTAEGETVAPVTGRIITP